MPAGVCSRDADKEGNYRYALWECWNDNEKVLFVMLNPSFADKTQPDHTQQRCRRFACREGYGGYFICNLFAYITPRREELGEEQNPVGYRNDAAIGKYHEQAKKTVVAWGHIEDIEDKVKIARERVSEVLKMLGEPVWCFGIHKKDGCPKHPCFLKNPLQLERYSPKTP